MYALKTYKENNIKGGFTLLEVMAAMAILAVSLVAIFNAQSQSMKMSERAGYITKAMNLAQARLGELELEVLEKGFDVLEEEDNGNFEDADFAGYRWAYTSDNIRIPLVSVNEDTKSVSDNSLLKTAQDMLEKSIKEVRLKVYFKDGRSEDFVELVTHYSDPKALNLSPTSTSGGTSQGAGGQATP